MVTKFMHELTLIKLSERKTHLILFVSFLKVDRALHGDLREKLSLHALILCHLIEQILGLSKAEKRVHVQGLRLEVRTDLIRLHGGNLIL